MNPERIRFDAGTLELDDSLIEELLSSGEASLDAHTRELAASLKERCLEVSTPEAAVVRLAASESSDNKHIAAHGVEFRTGGTIAKMMRGANAYALFIATTGPGPEKLAHSLLEKGEYLEAYLLDMYASALTEAVAEGVHGFIREKALKEGEQITNRYSPGYCGWDVTEQQKLFGLFPGDCCGISLSASSLMTPIKSISGLVGLGPEVHFRDYTCELCAMKECIYRRTREGRARLSVS
jgi:hypothetical protein